ncbi:hypothetical protein F5Y15DRAFT_326471 [Xylariaceae sp. FL0016]|nr:hypothetical protein F5Y15DRAFT_326471 [Xylariaceae sp. FL0016]
MASSSQSPNPGKSSSNHQEKGERKRLVKSSDTSPQNRQHAPDNICDGKKNRAKLRTKSTGASNKSKPLSSPLRESSVTHQGNIIRRPGTRGFLVPSPSISNHEGGPGKPQSSTQPYRLRNPTIHLRLLPASTAPSRLQGSGPDDAQPEAHNIQVRLYHCRSLQLSNEFKLTPRTGDLVSAAIPFLNQCETEGRRAGVSEDRGNHAASSLDPTEGQLIRQHGGLHVHYPDSDVSGSEASCSDVTRDWEEVLRVYSAMHPGGTMYVGVGSGMPSRQCC